MYFVFIFDHVSETRRTVEKKSFIARLRTVPISLFLYDYQVMHGGLIAKMTDNIFPK